MQKKTVFIAGSTGSPGGDGLTTLQRTDKCNIVTPANDHVVLPRVTRADKVLHSAACYLDIPDDRVPS